MTTEYFIAAHGAMCTGQLIKTVDIQNVSSGYEVHSCARCSAKYWITYKDGLTQFTIVCNPRVIPTGSRQLTLSEMFQ